jgi:AraC-like DNA-binding protein
MSHIDKITRKTPQAFFMKNKLLKAKKLLEENNLTTSQISDLLYLSDSSYLAFKNKEHFGLSAKMFLNQLYHANTIFL